MTQAESIDSLFERFLALEKREGWMEREVCGVRAWHLIRFSVFEYEILPKFFTVGAAHPDVMNKAPEGAMAYCWDRVKGIWRFFWKLITGFTSLPGILSPRADVVFAADSGKFRQGADGSWCPFIGYFEKKLGVRTAYLITGKSSAALLRRGIHGYDLNAYDARVSWFGRFGLCGSMMDEVSEFCRVVAEALQREFAVSVGVQAIVKRLRYPLFLRLGAYSAMKRMLRRLAPKILVTVCHYNPKFMVLGEVARELGIKVVEFQHGTIYPSHPAYNLPVAGSEYSPDYLLAWGQTWANQSRNYALKRIVNVGYPHLESLLAANPRKGGGTGTTVLFISQGTVGAELSRVAVELCALLDPSVFRIQYKLHPNETKSWRRLYPWLEHSGVEVIDNVQSTIYQLFASADVTVGVYSTAVIEGWMWGVPSYVMKNIFGADTMTRYQSTGMIDFVSSAHELAERLRGGIGAAFENRFRREDFWERDSVANIVSELAGMIRS